MSDKGMIMYDAVTEIRDDIIEQAADYKFRKSPMWLIKPLGIAASICLVGGAAVFAAVTLSRTNDIPVTNSVTEAAGNAVVTAASETIAGYITTAVDDTVYPTGTLASIVTFSTTLSEGLETVPPYGKYDAAYTGETTLSSDAAVTADTTQSTQESSADENVVVVPDDGGDDVNPGQVIIDDGDDDVNPGQVIIDDGDDDANPGGGGGILMLREYDPPVMPLTAGSETSGITAERELTFDLTETQVFADLHDAQNIDNVGIIEVNDSYKLTNITDVDKTITLMYPFECSLNALEGSPFISENYIGSHIPTVTIDGKTVKTGLIAGDFSGYFSSASYPAKDDKSNLDEYYSAEDYLTLLGDGSYLKEALEAPKTIGEKVVIYRIHDYGTTLERSQPLRDTLSVAVSYKVDDNVRVTTQGFNGFQQKDGLRMDFFSLPYKDVDGEDLGDRFIVVRGGDIEDVKLQGYIRNPDLFGDEEGEESSEIYGEIERIEKTADDDLLKQFITEISTNVNLRGAYASYKNGVLTDDVIYSAILKYMCKYGEYSDKPIERYDWGRMESQISDAVLCERIMYATFDVTIPAGGSVTVNAKHRRYADMNELDEDGHADYGLYMYTTLGSTLDISSQSVDVIGLPDVDITEGNIGTDVKNGKLHSDIDSKEKMYYLRFVPKK